MVLNGGAQPIPPGHWALPGDRCGHPKVWGSGWCVLLGSSGQKPRKLLIILPCTGQPRQQRIIQLRIPTGFRYRNSAHHLPFLRPVKYPPNSSWSIIYCKLITRASLEDRARIINWFEDKLELERRLQTVSHGSSGTGGLSGWHDTPCLRWTEGKDRSNLTDDFSVWSLKITT